MKKVFTLVMALAVMVGSSVYAQSNDRRRDNNDEQPRIEQRGGGAQNQGQRPQMNKPRKEKIDMSKLSEAQRNEVREIQKKYSVQLSDLSLDIKKQGNVIKAEMMKDEPNKATIDSAIDTGSNLKAQRSKLMFEQKLAIKAIVDAAK